MAGFQELSRRRLLVPTGLLCVALTGCSQLSGGDIDAAETTVGYTDSTEADGLGSDVSGADTTAAPPTTADTAAAESTAAPTTAAPTTASTAAPTTAPPTTAAPTTAAPTTAAPTTAAPTTAAPTTQADGGTDGSTLPRTGPSEAALFVAVGSVMILAGRSVFDALGLIDRRRWMTKGGGAPLPPR